MKKFNREEAFHLIEQLGVTNAAKEWCTINGVPFETRYIHKLIRYKKKKELEYLKSTSKTQDYVEGVTRLSALKPDGTLMTIDEYCQHYTIPRGEVRSWKLITHQGKEAYYNIVGKASNTEEVEEFYTQVLEDLRNYKGLPKKAIKTLPEDTSEHHLLVIDPADVHIGKLCTTEETGSAYNMDIAEKRVYEGVQGILDKVKGFKIDKILFVGGNDILHIDTPKRTTTSGTPQDTDGMWYQNFLKAKEIYINCIEMLMEVADVHFVFNPSNHDYMSGFFLADLIKTYYSKSNNITFDTSIAHRKYFTYFNNLIGTTHGDSAKNTDLGPLMAHEAKDWSFCNRRYIYTHHVHHKVSKDYIGVTIEALRSPSGTDSWHDKNGYTGVPKAIEGFLHHKKHGQVARITHNF